MTTTITITDQTTAGETTEAIQLDFLTERITVEELIRSRVHQEVKDYNAEQSVMFHGLVQPTDAEQTLNGYRLKNFRHLDWKKQFAAAITAFEENRFLVLVDDKQADGLATEIVVSPSTSIAFLKLVPLVGG